MLPQVAPLYIPDPWQGLLLTRCSYSSQNPSSQVEIWRACLSRLWCPKPWLTPTTQVFREACCGCCCWAALSAFEKKFIFRLATAVVTYSSIQCLVGFLA
jgi:hypothetical protein